MSAAVVSLPNAGHVPGQSHRRATLRKRKDREILLAIIEEHQRHIAHSQKRIGELLADLRALDGYRDLNWAISLEPAHPPPAPRRLVARAERRGASGTPAAPLVLASN